jgi:hypothetical protein
MKGLENSTYLIAYIISNIVAILLLVLALKQPRLTRLLFLVLFLWASWTNWGIVLKQPAVYLDYADFTFLQVYKIFITGWFSEHILLCVGFIATCQGLIGISLMFKGWLYKAAVIGGTIFLVAIFPFGVGSAFPATLVMAAGLGILYKEHGYYLWERKPATLTF